MEPIEFVVFGEPKPQGSKRAVPIRRKGGAIVMGKHGPMTRVIDDNPQTKAWRQEVAQVASQAYAGPLLTGPVALTLLFHRPRPKSHFGTGRNAGRLKASAPEHPTTRPDTLKLARAVEDALTGVIWRDDSQVVRQSLEKRYGERFRVYVKIEAADTAGGNHADFTGTTHGPDQLEAGG